MSRTPEERLSSLEGGFQTLERGLERMEKALEKIDANVSSLVDKLDNRYPSQESVKLRFEDVKQDILDLRTEVGESKRQIDRIRSWQYKVIGGVTLAAFVLGIIARWLFKL